MRISILLVLTLSLSLSSCLRTPVREYDKYAQQAPEKEELKILSWNIYMLPPLIKRQFKKKRARRIPEVILPEGYDIIVFQESFHFWARHILRRKLKQEYPYQYGPANMRAASIRTNSGIWIVSKIPLTPLGTVRYDECSGFDCMSRKGSALLEGTWQGQQFQILGTHLESGDQEVRNTQYPQVRAILDEHKKDGVPQIICGDFNTAKKSADYPKMLEMLDAEDGELLNQEITLDGTSDDFKNRGTGRTSAKIIDYIFYRGNGHVPKKMEREARQPEYPEPWKKTYVGLADHNAVELRIVF